MSLCITNNQLGYPPCPEWDDSKIPNELIEEYFSSNEISDKINLSMVCKRYNKLIEKTWKVIGKKINNPNLCDRPQIEEFILLLRKRVLKDLELLSSFDLKDSFKEDIVNTRNILKEINTVDKINYLQLFNNIRNVLIICENTRANYNIRWSEIDSFKHMFDAYKDVMNWFNKNEEQLAALTHRSFKNIGLTAFPPMLLKFFQHISELNLEGNFLNFLPPEIEQLKELTLFIVCKNQIEKLPVELIKLSKLKDFYITDNEGNADPRRKRNIKFICDLSRKSPSFLGKGNNVGVYVPDEIWDSHLGAGVMHGELIPLSYKGVWKRIKNLDCDKLFVHVILLSGLLMIVGGILYRIYDS
jgi:hypothetical protein